MTRLLQRQNVLMPQEISTTPAPSFQEPNSFDLLLERNQKGLIALAAVIALAAGGFAIYRGVKSSEASSAGEALSEAKDAASLEAIVKDYSGAAAAGSAQVLLAEKQWNDSKKDESIATLQKFLSEKPEHPAIPAAQASLGAKLAANGKLEQATAIFEKLAGGSSYLAPYALISLGDLYKDGGKLDQAEASYKRVQSDFPSSLFVQGATERLGALKAKPPTEVEGLAQPTAPQSDVPEFNLGSPSSIPSQLPFESPATPADGGSAPGTPGQP